jgi:hypothetical protein
MMQAQHAAMKAKAKEKTWTDSPTGRQPRNQTQTAVANAALSGFRQYNQP